MRRRLSVRSKGRKTREFGLMRRKEGGTIHGKRFYRPHSATQEGGLVVRGFSTLLGIILLGGDGFTLREDGGAQEVG
jgi:hypothetical protein